MKDMNPASEDSLQKVRVYIRTGNKKAKGIILPKQIRGDELRRIISEKVNIPIDSLALFNQGAEIKETAHLIANNIIHAIDLRSVNLDNIHVYFKSLEKNSQRTEFEVNTNTIIKQFINDNLLSLYQVDPDDMFMVYTGKQVDVNKNFKEEMIEDHSEVICVKCSMFRKEEKKTSVMNLNEGVDKRDSEKSIGEKISSSNLIEVVKIQKKVQVDHSHEEKVLHGGRREVEVIIGGQEVTAVHKIQQAEESGEKAHEKQVKASEAIENSQIAVQEEIRQEEPHPVHTQKQAEVIEPSIEEKKVEIPGQSVETFHEAVEHKQQQVEHQAHEENDEMPGQVQAEDNQEQSSKLQSAPADKETVHQEAPKAEEKQPEQVIQQHHHEVKEQERVAALQAHEQLPSTVINQEEIISNKETEEKVEENDVQMPTQTIQTQKNQNDDALHVLEAEPVHQNTEQDHFSVPKEEEMPIQHSEEKVQHEIVEEKIEEKIGTLESQPVPEQPLKSQPVLEQVSQTKVEETTQKVEHIEVKPHHEAQQEPIPQQVEVVTKLESPVQQEATNAVYEQKNEDQVAFPLKAALKEEIIEPEVIQVQTVEVAHQIAHQKAETEPQHQTQEYKHHTIQTVTVAEENVDKVHNETLPSQEVQKHEKQEFVHEQKANKQDAETKEETIAQTSKEQLQHEVKTEEKFEDAIVPILETAPIEATGAVMPQTSASAAEYILLGDEEEEVPAKTQVKIEKLQTSVPQTEAIQGIENAQHEKIEVHQQQSNKNVAETNQQVPHIDTLVEKVSEPVQVEVETYHKQQISNEEVVETVIHPQQEHRVETQAIAEEKIEAQKEEAPQEALHEQPKQEEKGEQIFKEEHHQASNEVKTEEQKQEKEIEQSVQAVADVKKEDNAEEKLQPQEQAASIEGAEKATIEEAKVEEIVHLQHHQEVHKEEQVLKEDEKLTNLETQVKEQKINAQEEMLEEQKQEQPVITELIDAPAIQQPATIIKEEQIETTAHQQPVIQEQVLHEEANESVAETIEANIAKEEEHRPQEEQLVEPVHPDSEKNSSDVVENVETLPKAQQIHSEHETKAIAEENIEVPEQALRTQPEQATKVEEIITEEHKQASTEVKDEEKKVEKETKQAAQVEAEAEIKKEETEVNKEETAQEQLQPQEQATASLEATPAEATENVHKQHTEVEFAAHKQIVQETVPHQQQPVNEVAAEQSEGPLNTKLQTVPAQTTQIIHQELAEVMSRQQPINLQTVHHQESVEIHNHHEMAAQEKVEQPQQQAQIVPQRLEEAPVSGHQQAPKTEKQVQTVHQHQDDNPAHLQSQQKTAHQTVQQPKQAHLQSEACPLTASENKQEEISEIEIQKKVEEVAEIPHQELTAVHANAENHSEHAELHHANTEAPASLQTEHQQIISQQIQHKEVKNEFEPAAQGQQQNKQIVEVPASVQAFHPHDEDITEITQEVHNKPEEHHQQQTVKEQISQNHVEQVIEAKVEETAPHLESAPVQQFHIEPVRETQQEIKTEEVHHEEVYPKDSAPEKVETVPIQPPAQHQVNVEPTSQQQQPIVGQKQVSQSAAVQQGAEIIPEESEKVDILHTDPTPVQETNYIPVEPAQEDKDEVAAHQQNKQEVHEEGQVLKEEEKTTHLEAQVTEVQPDVHEEQKQEYPAAKQLDDAPVIQQPATAVHYQQIEPAVHQYPFAEKRHAVKELMHHEKTKESAAEKVEEEITQIEKHKPEEPAEEKIASLQIAPPAEEQANVSEPVHQDSEKNSAEVSESVETLPKTQQIHAQPEAKAVAEEKIEAVKEEVPEQMLHEQPKQEEKVEQIITQEHHQASNEVKTEENTEQKEHEQPMQGETEVKKEETVVKKEYAAEEHLQPSEKEVSAPEDVETVTNQQPVIQEQVLHEEANESVAETIEANIAKEEEHRPQEEQLVEPVHPDSEKNSSDVVENVETLPKAQQIHSEHETKAIAEENIEVPEQALRTQPEQATKVEEIITEEHKQASTEVKDEEKKVEKETKQAAQVEAEAEIKKEETEVNKEETAQEQLQPQEQATASLEATPAEATENVHKQHTEVAVTHKQVVEETIHKQAHQQQPANEPAVKQSEEPLIATLQTAPAQITEPVQIHQKSEEIHYDEIIIESHNDSAQKQEENTQQQTQIIPQKLEEPTNSALQASPKAQEPLQEVKTENIVHQTVIEKHEAHQSFPITEEKANITIQTPATLQSAPEVPAKIQANAEMTHEQIKQASPHQIPAIPNLQPSKEEVAIISSQVNAAPFIVQSPKKQEFISSLPYHSSQQLPTESSLFQQGQKNLEVIAHIKTQVQSQSAQKGVVLENIDVKAPHSTKLECLIYQQQEVIKSVHGDISIIPNEEPVAEDLAQSIAHLTATNAEASIVNEPSQNYQPLD